MKNLNCIYFIKNKCDFLPNRLIFQQESPGREAALEKLHQISTSEEFRKLNEDIQKSCEQALKNDPRSYLTTEYIPTNEKRPNSFVCTDRPDAAGSLLSTLRFRIKEGNLDEKTKQTYQVLIEKLELYNDFRRSLNVILKMVVIAESELNYKKNHNEKFAFVEGTLAAQAIDLINEIRGKKNQYLPITTYTDILHPEAIQYVRDFLEKEESEPLKKAKRINDECRKLI